MHLEAEGLTREFGPIRAVDGVSFSLERGEFLTVFGPNGAGKTSLLRLLAGGLRPTRGDVRIAGSPLRPGDREWHRPIGVLSHKTFLYGHLTARENLRFYGRLFGVDGLEAAIEERLSTFALLGRADDQARTLSRGMRQRLALARALLHDPEIVLLDEPYTGLDPHAASLLREVLATLKHERRTVVLVTHNLTQGLELADRVVIQFRGRFVFHERREEVESEGFDHFYRETVDAAG